MHFKRGGEEEERVRRGEEERRRDEDEGKLRGGEEEGRIFEKQRPGERAHLETCNASGKPSTWFPLGRFVDRQYHLSPAANC